MHFLGPTLTEKPLSSLQLLGTLEWLALVWYGVFVTALAFIFGYADKTLRGINSCGVYRLDAIHLAAIFVYAAGRTPWLAAVGGACLVVTGMLLTGLTRQQEPFPRFTTVRRCEPPA